MAVVYEEIPEDAFKPHDTYIIAYCPDTDTFFATNQRCFFWDYEQEFPSEQDAIKYFEANIKYFANVRYEILTDMNQKVYDYIYFERSDGKTNKYM